MKAYWLIAFTTLLLHKIMPIRTNADYLRNLIIAFIPFFIYGAIRVNYGNDYSAYELYFDMFHGSTVFIPDHEAHAEIGYQFLCHIMPNYRSILVLNAFLLAAAFVVVIYKNVPSKYAWLAIFLLFLMPEKNVFGSLVGIRNGLVVSIFMLTFIFVQQRKPIHIFITALLLSTIHTSAIVYLPLAYVISRNTPISKKEVYIWLVSGIILMLMSMSTLINILMPIFSIVAGRYEEMLMEMEDTSRGLLNYSANLVMMFSFIYFAYKHSDKLLPEQRSLLRMAALYCVSGCLGGISGRMTYYYAMYYIAGVVLMLSFRWRYDVLRVIMLLFVIVIAYYATFVVWMGSPYFVHDVYHSLIGDL